MASIKPAEVSEILKQQLEGLQTGASLEEVGTVLQVGDGIARLYGLSNVQSNELIEFDNCIFNKSDFSNFNFSTFEFTECTFNSCDFSMACLTNTVLSGVNFINCTLLGVDFSRCSKFAYSVKFENCILDYCSFIRNNLGKVIFRNSSIREATFSARLL